MSITYRRSNQSIKGQSNFLLNTKFNVSKQKIKGFFSSSSTPKNPQAQMRLLPQLSRSSMRKSYSTFQSDRNTKFKLTTLQDKLNEVHSIIHLTRQQAKESIQYTKTIKTNLMDKQLVFIQKDLKQQISGLQNLINCTKNDHKLRTNDIKQDYNNLWDTTQSIKQQIFLLRMKVDQVQINMGYQK